MFRIQIAALALGLISAGFAPAADVDSYLPNESEVVASLNVDQLLNSPLGKRYLRAAIEQGLKDNPQVGDILKYAELDPFKDISRVTLSMWGKDNALVIVGGKFNRQKISDLAAKAAADQPDKVKVHKTDGLTIFETIDGKKSTFTAFASDATILMSPDITILKDVLTKTSGKVGQVKKELAALIAKADAKQTLWAAALPSVTSAIPLPPTDNPQQKQAVNGLESIAGALNVETDARLTLSLNNKTAQAAQIINKQIIDGVNLLKLFLPSAAKDKPEIVPLVEVLGTIRSLAKGKTVVVTAEMTGAQIEKAVNSVKKDK
jgi:hypothetical protein